MNKLLEIQEGMQDYVLRQDPLICEFIQKPYNMEAQDRLQVYRNAYYLRLTDILAKDYSALKIIMGDEVFGAMIRSYLGNFPSHHYSVRYAGKHLAKFLKNTEGCHPSFAELAEFEWALNMALLAADASTLTLQDLSQVSSDRWHEMQLFLHPSVMIMACHYNTVARWQHLDEKQLDIEPVHAEQPQPVLIWRQHNRASFIVLSEQEKYLIDLILAQLPFGEICERVLNYFEEDEAVQWVAENLQVWIGKGIFSCIKLPQSSVEN